MQTQWTSHLKTEEEKEKFRDMVRSSSTVIARLKDICHNKLEGIDRPKEEDFESPSWAQKTAYTIGQRKVLADLLNLLTIE